MRFLFVRLFFFALSALSELPSAATKGRARVRTVTAGPHQCTALSAAAFVARRAEHVSEKRSLKSWDTDMAEEIPPAHGNGARKYPLLAAHNQWVNVSLVLYRLVAWSSPPKTSVNI